MTTMPVVATRGPVLATMKLRSPALIAAFLFAVSGCAHIPPPPTTAQWTYPENPGWGAACEAPPPPQQSPIDFTKVAKTPWNDSVVVPQATFDPHDQNVVFSPSPGPSVSMAPGIDGKSEALVYTPGSFHFHHSNEHVIEGRPVFELHIKTKDQHGNAAVFAALWAVDEGVSDDPTLLAAYKSLSAPPGSVQTLDLGSVLWRFGREPFFSYLGSLTTPPCSGNIRWFVLQTPIRTPSALLNRLKAKLVENGMPSNNVRTPRPIAQPQPAVYLVTPKK